MVKYVAGHVNSGGRKAWCDPSMFGAKVACTEERPYVPKVDFSKGMKFMVALLVVVWSGN